MSYHTHISGFNGHLGDQLWHLNWLRRTAQKYPDLHFTHAAPYQYIRQLVEITCDLPNITLISEEYKNPLSVDAWVNHGGFSDIYFSAHSGWDVMAMLIAHFKDLSRKLGLDQVIIERDDLLFDYPGLKRRRAPVPFDFLIMNQPPMSGQFTAYNVAEFDDFIKELKDEGYSVFSTAPNTAGVPFTMASNLSVTDVGGISLDAKYIIGVPNGPIWPTFNVINRDTVKLRIMTVFPHHTTIPSCNTYSVSNLNAARKMLIDRGLLPASKPFDMENFRA